VDGGGGKPGKLVAEKDMLIGRGGPLAQVAAQRPLSLRGEVDRAFPLPFSACYQAWFGFVQVQIGEQNPGDFPNSETAPEHEQKHGPVTHPVVWFSFGGRGVLDGGEEGPQSILLHRSRQALPLAQGVAARQHRADDLWYIVREKGVEGDERGQAAVDGSGQKAARLLQIHEAVHLAEGNRSGWDIPDQGGELAQVVAVVLPGARFGIAPAHPVDELVDLG